MKTTLLTLCLSLLILSGCGTQTSTTNNIAPNPSEVDDNTVEEIEEVVEPVDEIEEIGDEDAEPASLYDLSTITISSNGTEPFRNFVASGTNLVWTEPSFAGPITTTAYVVSMTQTPTTITLVGSGINALLTLQPCSDGMSDIAYTHEAAITKGSDTFNGCANITP